MRGPVALDAFRGDLFRSRPALALAAGLLALGLGLGARRLLGGDLRLLLRGELGPSGLTGGFLFFFVVSHFPNPYEVSNTVPHFTQTRRFF